MKYYITTLFVLAAFLGCSSSGDDNPAPGPSPICRTDCGVGPVKRPTDPGSGGALGTVLDKVAGQDPKSVDPGLRELGLVHHLVFGVIQPSMVSLKEQSKALSSSITQVCQTTEVLDLQAMRKQWEEATKAFHRVEPFLFGPLFTDNVTQFGPNNSFKRFLYSQEIPETQASLLADQVTRAAAMKDKYKPRTSAAIMGLDAIEYVLYVDLGDETSISGEHDSCWYLSYLQKNLDLHVEALTKKWTDEILLPLDGPDGQTKAKVYITQFAQGMIDFVDKTLKDRRAEAPMGLEVTGFACDVNINCHTRYLEHQYHGDFAKQSLVESLQSLEKAFGLPEAKVNDGFGINAFVEAGGTALTVLPLSLASGQLSAQWQDLPGGDDLLTLFAEYNGTGELRAPYSLLKSFSDYMKTDFVLDLNVKLPGSVQGDND